jgi:hypothetical protein
MPKFSIVCKENWEVLETIEANSFSEAKRSAQDRYPGLNVAVVYNDPCLTAD